jgi:hypothetical protein
LETLHDSLAKAHGKHQGTEVRQRTILGSQGLYPQLGIDTRAPKRISELAIN